MTNGRRRGTMRVTKVFLIPALMTLVILVAIGLWSDHRDRRAGIDPKMRVDHLEQRRRRLREERTNREVRRYLGDADVRRDGRSD